MYDTMPTTTNNTEIRSTTTSAQRSRTFADHYGSVRRSASPARVLRVYPPLGWGVGVVRAHVQPTDRKSVAHNALDIAARLPLAL